MVCVVVLVCLLPGGGSFVGVVWVRFGGRGLRIFMGMVIGSGLRGLGLVLLFFFFLRPLLLEFASTSKEGASMRGKVNFEDWDHLSTFL